MKNSNIRYFNTHTEGFCFINGFKEISPKSGQNFKPFWSSSLTLLEGNPESPKKKYFHVSVVGEKVIGLLKHYQQQLNSDVPVFANVRLADIDAEPYAANGKAGINWSAKIISILYLKVGDQVIELKEPTTTDFGVRVDPQDKSNSIESVESDDDLDDVTQLFGFPLIVELRKDDPQFQVICDRLKMTGYRWNKVKNVWMKAEVTLDKSNNPNFQQMFNLLKQAGYYWSAEAKVWKHPDFDQKPAGTNRYQGSRQSYPSQARA